MSALLNPLIIDTIFKHLDLPTIKLVRLVSRDFSDFGASHLGRRTVLQTDEIDLAPDNCLNFNPKLGRRLYIGIIHFSAEDEDDRLEWNISRYSNLRIIMAHVNQFTTEMEICISKKECPYIVEALSGNNSFPNLRSMKVFVYDCLTTGNDVDYSEEIPTFPIRSSMRAISYQTEAKNFCVVYKFPFRPVLQGLINSSPNLNELAIVDNFYPDLSSLLKLKVLSWKGSPVCYKPLVWAGDLGCITFIMWKDEECKAAKLRDIMQESLEQLVLETARLRDESDYVLWHPRVSSILEFELPPLSNLSFLDVQGIHYFAQLGVSITPKLLPSLKRITLIEVVGEIHAQPVEVGMQAFLNSLPSPHPGIETLSLQLIQDISPIAIKRIGSVWPNIAKLEVIIQPRLFDEKDQTLMYPERIEAFLSWRKLEEFHLDVRLRYNVAKAFPALRTLATFPGLKSMEVQGQADHLRWPSWKFDLLELTKDFKSFTFRSVRFKVATHEKVMQMKEIHQLPLHFEGCRCVKEGDSWDAILCPLNKFGVAYYRVQRNGEIIIVPGVPAANRLP